MKIHVFQKFLFALVVAAYPLAAVQAQDIKDPLEDVNRGVFWFNDKLDVNFLEPVAQAYDDVMPDPIHQGVTNFFGNLRYPSYLVSDLVQFKFQQALEHTGRFVINSTIGLFGLIDVAKDFGLEDHREDFGIALAYHDVPPGPYLVLPIVGPSNLRDGVGLLVDFFLDPFVIFSLESNARAGVVDPITYSAYGLKLVNTRAGLLEAITAAKESSVDYYLFMQSAYYQYRRGLLYDGNPPDEEEDIFDDQPANPGVIGQGVAGDDEPPVESEDSEVKGSLNPTAALAIAQTERFTHDEP